MIPNASGVAITLHRGDILQFDRDFTCPSPLVWGNCEIVVFVQSDTGRRILQSSKRSLPSMVYMVNRFDLISPVDDDTVETQYPAFIWSASADPDSGFAVNYLVQISDNVSFTNPIVSDELSDTTWTSTVALPYDSTYHWKVLATNGHAPERSSSQVFDFTIYHPTGGCPYVLGDINGNGQANGIDVTFAVSYFKGGAPPPIVCDNCPEQGQQLYAAGDVNGNCNFNGIDITYMVGYYRGGPGFSPCPSCPPAR
jgi:hypothetical protein